MLVNPRSKPSPDVAAAGDRREVIEFFEQSGAGESLEYAESEARAANAAAGKAECGAFKIEQMDALIDFPKPPLLFLFGRFLRALGARLTGHLLFEHIGQRFGLSGFVLHRPGVVATLARVVE